MTCRSGCGVQKPSHRLSAPTELWDRLAASHEAERRLREQLLAAEARIAELQGNITGGGVVFVRRVGFHSAPRCCAHGRVFRQPLIDAVRLGFCRRPGTVRVQTGRSAAC